MNHEPTNAEKMRKLPWSIASDAANSVFAQLTFFGSVFVLFLNALNLSKSQIGFLLSLITFFGLIALFVAPAIARFGYKRTYLAFFGTRKVITAFLLLTPWVSIRYGPQTTLIYVAVIIILFAICRAVAVTAVYPWMQEYVPNSVRGKYSATNNIFATLVSLIAVAGAGYVIEHTTGLNGFTLLFGIGVFFGAISVWTATYIPGGASTKGTEAEVSGRNMMDPLRDADFLKYIAGAGLITLALVPLASFLPLFMQEQVGLSPGNVVLLQTGTMLGGLLSTFFWGWTADRYGSKPVMLSGVLLMALLPVCWLLMPRHSQISLYVALLIAFGQGLAHMGWGIGAGRLLFVSIVPAAQKTVYMAVYYAAVEVVSGISQVLGGQIVQLSAGISGQFFIFTLDAYTILFVLGIILPLLSIMLFRNVRSDSGVTMGQFAGLFLRGNAFMAMRSLVRYHLSKDEATTVSITEHLGRAKSPLTVEELLVSLEDPRFNVRFETIISIARTRPDPRLTEALIKVLNGTELSLTVIAAWALGRIGDPAAIEPLRASLNSPYRSIQAHSARALSTLGDKTVIPLLLARLKTEPDKGLRMAYASALGKLGAMEATGDLLALLKTTENKGAQMSLALALVQIAGDEERFIRLWRRMREDTGTTVSQRLAALSGRLGRGRAGDDALLAAMRACSEAMARADLAQGAVLMSHLIQLLPRPYFEGPGAMILQACAEHLGESHEPRLAYLVLALHALEFSDLSEATLIFPSEDLTDSILIP